MGKLEIGNWKFGSSEVRKFGLQGRPVGLNRFRLSFLISPFRISAFPHSPPPYYKFPVLPLNLEQSLRDLPRSGTLIKDRGYRQIWRFEHAGRAYYLKYYPKGGFRDWLRRRFRGSPAMAEFTRLQSLQKAKVPAPRAVAAMMGFKIDGRVGDAVIIEAIEPSETLEQLLQRHLLAGEPIPNHLRLARQVRQLVQQLGRARLGHNDLHLGNFLLSNGQLFLLDGYAVKTGGLRLDHVLLLGHSAAPYSTTTDLLRGWEALGPGTRMPRDNRVSRRLWRQSFRRVTGENRYFGKLSNVAGGWGGHYVKRSVARPWSTASRLEFTATDWERAWPMLLKQMEADRLDVLKRSPSGEVVAGEIVVGGKPLAVVIKRPKRRYWYRYLNEVGRGSRPRRAWTKAWRAIVRDLPTAWPLAILERRRFGYVVDAVIIFERVPGQVLADADLSALSGDDRDRFFRRVGRVLRRIESFGWSHFDAKSNNWILHAAGEPGGPWPVMLDIDAIRRRRWTALGVQRLLKSMTFHPQYTRADSLALCQGYAPAAEMVVEAS